LSVPAQTYRRAAAPRRRLPLGPIVAALVGAAAFLLGLAAGDAAAATGGTTPAAKSKTSSSPGAQGATGGLNPSQADSGLPSVAGSKAHVTRSGLAIPPSDAPLAVKRVILAGNKIAKKPYLWGGGHGSWIDSGYDCSGSVSFALHGGSLLNRPLAGEFRTYGAAGQGRWITTYINSSHVYMTIAGLRFDTSAQRENGSRWSAQPRSWGSGFVSRHPRGL
jgi:hypothetical protein